METSENEKCGRERYWEECSFDEKIERMRQVIKVLQRQVDGLATMTAKLALHQHGKDGRLVIGLLDGSCELGQFRVNDDNKEVYF